MMMLRYHYCHHHYRCFHTSNNAFSSVLSSSLQRQLLFHRYSVNNNKTLLLSSTSSWIIKNDVVTSSSSSSSSTAASELKQQQPQTQQHQHITRHNDCKSLLFNYDSCHRRYYDSSSHRCYNNTYIKCHYYSTTTTIMNNNNNNKKKKPSVNIYTNTNDNNNNDKNDDNKNNTTNVIPSSPTTTATINPMMTENDMIRHQLHIDNHNSNNNSTSPLSSDFQKRNNHNNQRHHSIILPNHPTLYNDEFKLIHNYTIVNNNNSSIDNNNNNTIIDPNNNKSYSSLSIANNMIDLKGLYNPAIHLPSAPQVWGSEYETLTPLCNELISYIGIIGRPISYYEYIKMSLQHPLYGYYMNATTSKTKANDGKDDIIWDDEDVDDEISNDENNDKDNTKDIIIGPTGDFITAPEITSIFSECIAIWYATQYQKHYHNLKLQCDRDDLYYQFIEFGPGRGTCIIDIIQFIQQLLLQTTKHNNNESSLYQFATHCKYIHLIETSPTLRQIQKENMMKHQNLILNNNADDQQEQCRIQLIFPNNDNDNNDNMTKKNDDDVTIVESHTISNTNTIPITVYWHETISDYIKWQNQYYNNTNNNNSDTNENDNDSNQPNIPLISYCLGQEFLDALPIYSFEKTKNGYWRERMIDVAIRDDIAKDIYSDDDTDNDNKNTKTLPESSSDSIHNMNNNSTDSIATTSNKTSETNTKKTTQIKKPRLRIVLAPEVTPALKTLLPIDNNGYLLGKELDMNAPIGQIIEICPDAIMLLQDIKEHILLSSNNNGGAALFFDYGTPYGSTDSIRGYTKHQQVHFLSQPGYIDITSDVDFIALKHCINNNNNNNNTPSKPISTTKEVEETNDLSSSSSSSSTTTSCSNDTVVRAYGPISQGNFLMAMGLQERVVSLIERDDTSDEMAENYYNAMIQLASSDHMGERFQVLALTSSDNDNNDDNIIPPTGFTT